ncbi:UNVERIFIED_CONTAM: hypothetical protein RMT77_011448 [Armadillidium vulgare]
MSERKLASLDLGDDLQKDIKNANLKTVEDVLSKSFLQLMTLLHLSADETEDLIIQLSKECLPSCQKGAELLEKKLTSLPFCDPELDSLLQGGIHRGHLTELSGAPGVGKTQFSYQLAANCLKCSSPPNGVCFLDTELCFKADRVNEIIEGSLEAECDSSIMSKFYVFQVETVASFNEILSTLELFCIVNDIGLVIVDSIASLIRKEFSQDTKFERASTLASWAAQLKELADKLSISVIVTNQVTTKVFENSKFQGEKQIFADEGIKKEESRIFPALGNSWAHYVNTRFYLQFYQDSKELRQLIICKSPLCPLATKMFQITGGGVKFIGDYRYGYDVALVPVETEDRTSLPSMTDSELLQSKQTSGDLDFGGYFY